MPQFLGQPSQLLVKDAAQLAPAYFAGLLGVRALGGPALTKPATGGGGACLAGHPGGDAVQPAGQRRGPADRGGAAGQGEEGGLKSVLRVVFVAQHTAADTQHQRAMTLHQRRKGGLVALLDELPQKLLVWRRGLTQVGEDLLRAGINHGALFGRRAFSPYSARERREGRAEFWRAQSALDAARSSSTASRPVMPTAMPNAFACGVASTILASNRSSGSTSGFCGVPRAMASA